MEINGIAFIDLDGTVVTETTSVFAARHFGKGKYVSELDKSYLDGILPASGYLKMVAAMYEGKSLQELQDLYKNIPVINNVSEFLTALHSAKWKAYLCTVTWSFAAEAIAKRFGFDGFCGAEMDVKGGILTGKIIEEFDEQAKADFATKVCNEHGISPAKCVAIGDSLSDIKLFHVVGVSIAFNASEPLRKCATYAVQSQSILDVIPALQSAFDTFD